MAKHNAWGEAIKQQQATIDGIEPAPVEEKRRPGRCKCGSGEFTLSLEGDTIPRDLIRSCKRKGCGFRYNVDKGVYL